MIVMNYLMPILIKVVLPLIVIAIIHFLFGRYPKPFPLSINRKREIWETLILWVIPTIIVDIIVFTDLADQMAEPTLRVLIIFILIMIIPYILLPVIYQKYVKKWTIKDFGFAKPKRRGVVIFAIAFFTIGGILPLLDSGFKSLSLMIILYSLYQPAFIEEFFFRGIIQGKLERALGQKRAWIFSGILFGLTHFFINYYVSDLDLLPGLLMLVGQITFGWVYGIIYMKTRSLLPSMICHYLIDGRLASIIDKIVTQIT
jgi:membrane protease YdiL (CAAX protease family)